MEISKNQSVSSDYFENSLHNSMNLSSEWSKKIDILEGAFKSLRVKCKGETQACKSLLETNEELKRKIDLLEKKQKDNDEVRLLTAELKEEKKHKEKLKKLL